MTNSPLIPHPFRSIWFVDRADVWVKHRFKRAETDNKIIEDKAITHILNSVRQYCAKANLEDRYFGVSIHLSQPTPQAFKVLSSFHEIGDAFYLELAWDFIADGRYEAEGIYEWIVSHLIEPRRGKKKIHYYRDKKKDQKTKYSGQRIKHNVTVIYYSKPSKMTGSPCVPTSPRLE